MSPARVTLLVFLVLQAADGAITYAAVQIYGPIAEANPLVVTWMSIVGPAAALIGAKAIACGGGLILYVCGERRTLAALMIVYAVGVVLPWLHVLSSGVS
jgi:hypothetical protein